MSCSAVLLAAGGCQAVSTTDSMRTTQPPQQAHPACCCTHPQSRQRCQLQVRCCLSTPGCVLFEAAEVGVAPLGRALSRALGTHKPGHVLCLLGAHKLQGGGTASTSEWQPAMKCPECQAVASLACQAQVRQASTHVHAGAHVYMPAHMYMLAHTCSLTVSMYVKAAPYASSLLKPLQVWF